jgi:hypothetical protein
VVAFVSRPQLQALPWWVALQIAIPMRGSGLRFPMPKAEIPPMKPNLYIAVATRTLPELRRRFAQLHRRGSEGSPEELEIAEELFRRTDGCEGLDPAVRPWLLLLGRSAS